MNTRLIDRYVNLLRRRGLALTSQVRAAAQLMVTAPVDMRPALGPVLLLSQGFAKAQVSVLTWIMADVDFNVQPLRFQGYVASQAAMWTDLWAALANMAFESRMPSIESLNESSVASSTFGANARGVSISTSLEAVINTPGVAGVGFDVFWATSATARASLGRLLAMDNVVTRTYDFDVLAEAMEACGNLVPLVPDAVALIRRIEKARPVQVVDIAATKTQSRTVTQGLDLAALAQEVLGEADQWRQIATFNNLRYPYVSDNPLDQYGDAAGTVVLQEPTDPKVWTVSLVGTNGLFVDMRLYFDDGTHSEIATISAILDEHRVQLAVPLSRAYGVEAVVTVYPPDYEVPGKVLQPGDMVLIPIRSGSPDTAPIVQRTDEATQERLYGADLAVDASGLLRIENGDLATVSGTTNISQALRNRFKTAKGSLLHHPDYGFSLGQFIGYKHDPFFDFLAVVEGRQTALRDPRIERVENFFATMQGDTVVLEFTAITKNQEQFPAIRVSAPVRG